LMLDALWVHVKCHPLYMCLQLVSDDTSLNRGAVGVVPTGQNSLEVR
jgi:hypothetical protein